MATLPQSAIAGRPAGRPASLDAVLATRAGRLLVPSFYDFFVAALIAMLTVRGGGWIRLLEDCDTGWHIRTGDYIRAAGHVPYTDPFSFSKAGQPWFAWEWLTDVILSGLHSVWGLKGIVLFATLLLVAAIAVLLRTMVAAGVSAIVALPLALLATGSASIHYLARPHLVTILLMAIASGMLIRDRRHASWRIWLLVPLTALWANLHGGFLALIALVGLYFAGSAIEAWIGSPRDWSRTLRYGSLCAACAAASLINPYGWRLHSHIADYLRSDWIMNHVAEFQSPRFRSEPALQFELLLFAGLIAIVPLFEKRRIAEALSVAYFGYMALASGRHIPLYVIVATPQLGFVLSEWWERRTSGAPRASIAGILNALSIDVGAGLRRTTPWILAAPAFLLLWSGDSLQWPKDFPAKSFPVAMVNHYQDRIAGSRVLTMDQWADYLIYRSYPKQKVFFDGRSDFYGPAIGDDYLALMNGAWNWQPLMRKHGLDLVLAPTDWALNGVLKQAGWRVIADDGIAILFAPPAGWAEAAKGAAGEDKIALSGLMKTTLPAESTKRHGADD